MTTSKLDQHRSLWLATSATTKYPQLQGDLRVEVAVVGGGIAGILTALLLSRQGNRVALLEANRLAEAATGHTTAKVTVGHGLVYARMRKLIGTEKTALYAQANQSAVDRIAGMARDQRLDCDLARLPGYIFTQRDQNADQLQAEAEAAHAIGLAPVLTTETDLPFPVKLALRYDNQVVFHPRKFLLPLAAEIQTNGSQVYEQSRVLELEPGTDAHQLKLQHGTVTADHVVIATHFPFYDPAFFFVRMEQQRSYLLAAKLRGAVPAGMYYGIDDDFQTFRCHQDGKTQYFLIGGQAHKAGEVADTVARYEQLDQTARQLFAVEQITHSWSTQDPFTTDHVPFIGTPAPWAPRLHLATGFNGWGMTNAMVAAVLLADSIADKANPWHHVFTPTRLDSPGAKLTEAGKRALSAAADFLKDRFTTGHRSEIDQLQPGQGQVIESKGQNVAVCRDRQGNLHAHLAACRHMGCLVRWNAAEQSWDCPCHGSRYRADGTVLETPANAPLHPCQLNADAEPDG